MSTSAKQTLTVSNPVDKGSYVWEVSGGSLNTSVGQTVEFTAPSSNAGCSSNPTITLKGYNPAGELEVCDTLTITVNAIMDNYEAIRTWVEKRCQTISEYIKNAYITNITYNCAGDIFYGPCEASVQKSDYPNPVSCEDTYNTAISFPLCYSGTNTPNYLESISPVDLRTPGQIAAGCCPPQL
jgi:hypothetical protein